MLKLATLALVAVAIVSVPDAGTVPPEDTFDPAVAVKNDNRPKEYTGPLN